ncbi:MAG: TonB-dependent receptor [Acidobacteria bacterium]|nr:TonB-dependent receptor [Acidobacteriota bacterium]
MSLRLVCSLLFVSLALQAQESRGTIGGRVTDGAGAVIAGVKVGIISTDTGITTGLTTNEHGAYVAPLLLPGTYRIQAEHTGFKRFTRSGINLSVNDNLQIDISLELGDVSQSVDVTDAAPIIETADGSLGVIVTTKELTELPIPQGNPYALLGLAPGTTFEGNPQLNRPYEPTHIVDYSMSGSTSGTTDITLDGVSNTSKGSNGRVAAGYVPPVDAVGEIRIQTSSFDARTAQSSGGAVNISLRSGANKFHGSATYTKMRPEWFANDYFTNRSGLPAGDFNYDRWSGSFSGPIHLPKIYNGRNKTFFMWAYEQLKDKRPRGGSANLTVATPEIRNGDFSELLRIGSNYTIYNPFTRRQQTGSSTRYVQEPFPDNIIPASLINPVSKKVQEYFALPITAGTTVDHRQNYPQPTLAEAADYITHTVRLDHNFSSKNRMFLRGNGYDRNTSRLDYFKTQATGLREEYFPRGGSIDDVHAFSPTLVLNLRYGYTRFVRVTNPFHGRGFDLTTLGFPASFNSLISADQREFPLFNINGYFSTNNSGEARYMDTHSLVAAFTKLKGTHTFDFGFEGRAYKQNRYNGNTTRSGSFIFDPTWTRGPLDNSATAPIGQGYASFLLGLPNASSLIARNGDYAEQSTLWSGYVQDNWRVKRKLTLTIGIRYELEGPLTERYNRSIRNLDFSASSPIEAAARAAYANSYAANPTLELPPDQFSIKGGLLFAGVNGQSRELWERDKNNFAPRFGLAYAFNRKTVFRGGFGIYFTGLGLRRADVLQNGFSRNTNFIPSRDSGLSFYSTLSNPFPDGINEPVGSAQGLMTDVGNGITFFNPNPRAGYNQRWQASIQRQLDKTTVLEVAYVGDRSVHLDIGRDLNNVGNDQLSRSPFFDVSRVNYLSANIPNPFRNLPGVNGTLGTNAQIVRENLLKPFPHFTSVNTSTYQGHAWYHSLQVRANRRFSTGLSTNFSFTWAKNMQAMAYLNPADDMPYRSLSGADRRFRVTMASIYEMPFGRRGKLFRGVSKPVNAIIGGWQLSAVYTYQSGSPLNWGDVVYFGVGDDIRNGPRTVEQWFNVDSGFTRNTATRPASYHYRTWPFRFSNVRGPAMNNVDMSVNKRWRLNEKGMEIQFRAEAFNGFNHPQFSNPNTDQFNTLFGQITNQANYARQAQLHVRFAF